MTVVDDVKWRDLPPMSLEDLWLVDRSGSGLPFSLDYEILKGSFIPEIPYWLMLRFTKPGWTVYDAMAGSMTARRVGDRIARDVISVDIADRGPSDDPLYKELVLADARTYNPGPVDMVIAHFPYEDIIKFTDDPADLSNMDTAEYWDAIGECLNSFDKCLKPNCICAIVIGNIYSDGAITPLPAHMWMKVVSSTSWRLKGWITKDIRGNRQGQDNLWRARACKSDSFVFRSETILVFKKRVYPGAKTERRQ